MTKTEKDIWIATYAAVYATGRPVENCANIADRAVTDIVLARSEYAHSIRNRIATEKHGLGDR